MGQSDKAYKGEEGDDRDEGDEGDEGYERGKGGEGGEGYKVELWNRILKSLIKVGCPSRFKSFLSDFFNR